MAPPALGSLAIQAPQLTPQVVRVQPSTCHDLSTFKELLKEYRKLDDTINMRLNRTTARFRDRGRLSVFKAENVQDETCAYMWKELVANWQRRRNIIEYCVSIVDHSLDVKTEEMQEALDPAALRRIQAAKYSEEVKRRQVTNELQVEEIVRNRSLDAFRARCRYFQPPLTDADARKWWNEALSSNNSRQRPSSAL